MLSMSHIVLCTGVLAAVLFSAHGLSDEEKSAIHTLVRPFVEECGKEYGVSLAEIKKHKDDKTINELNPCLMSCVLKKMGLMDEQGMLDTDKAIELTTKFVPNEEDKNKALNIINTCSSVNEKEVSDGEAGCERAKLLIECYLPLKGELPGTP